MERIHGKVQRRVWLLVCITALLTSVYVGWTRHQTEKSSRTVAVVVDGVELRRLATAAGRDWTETLAELAAAGVTAVGVHEMTLGDALAEGQAFAMAAPTFSLLGLPETLGVPVAVWALVAPDATIVGWPRMVGTPPAESPPSFEFDTKANAADAEKRWLSQGVHRQIAALGTPLNDAGELELWVVSGSKDVQELAGLTLGFRPNELAGVADAGLRIVPRLLPDSQAGNFSFRERMKILADHDAGAIVFWGDHVSGYPDAIEVVAGELRALDAPLGIIEFADQSGMEALAKSLGYRVVRVHSITEQEMALSPEPQLAVDRWARAVRERGVRLLYTRLYMDENIEAVDSRQLLDHNLAYINSLITRLHNEGYVIGFPPPVATRTGYPWALIPAVLAVGAVAGRMVAVLSPSLDVVRAVGWFGGACVVSIGFCLLWLKGYTLMSRQIMALMAAVVFPVMATYAGVVHARGAPASQSDSSPGRWGERVRRVGRVLCSYALATGWALFGAALIVVLLDDVRFIAGLDSFRGVKFAHVVPLLLGAWVFWPRENESVSGENRHRGIGNRTVRFWIRLGGAVLLGGGLFVYVLRTGNQGLPVWHVEESVRRFLEETLGARPRTKEFLIGHPALILALVGMVRRRANRYVVAGATVLGTIGPISIINTFAHVHSPLALSLARTGYGWVLGLLVGGLVALVAAVVVRLGQPSLPPPDRSVGGPQP